MTTYAIIAPGPSTELKLAMLRTFGGEHFEFSPGQYVGQSPHLTAQGVVNSLGGAGEVGQISVFTVSGYWGFHRKELWEWLAVHGDIA